MKVLTTTEGVRFALLDDAPEVLVPIDVEWERSLLNDGMHPRNALALAVKAPFRVTWGFGAFSDFATLEGALAECNRIAEGWTDICGPSVIQRRWVGEADLEGDTIHDPTRGLFYAEAVRAEVAS